MYEKKYTCCKNYLDTREFWDNLFLGELSLRGSETGESGKRPDKMIR